MQCWSPPSSDSRFRWDSHSIGTWPPDIQSHSLSPTTPTVVLSVCLFASLLAEARPDPTIGNHHFLRDSDDCCGGGDMNFISSIRIYWGASFTQLSHSAGLLLLLRLLLLWMLWLCPFLIILLFTLAHIFIAHHLEAILQCYPFVALFHNHPPSANISRKTIPLVNEKSTKQATTGRMIDPYKCPSVGQFPIPGHEHHWLTHESRKIIKYQFSSYLFIVAKLNSSGPRPLLLAGQSGKWRMDGWMTSWTKNNSRMLGSGFNDRRPLPPPFRVFANGIQVEMKWTPGSS